MTKGQPASQVTPAGPLKGTWRRIFRALTSTKLALALLVGILLLCAVGVTAFRHERAWALIFSTVWFNGLLVLLAVSSAAAFFTRISRRAIGLLSAGMVVFHLSFLALLGGVVLNALFRFRGELRLTEGESLPVGAASSYDAIEAGRFFELASLKGDATLVRMYRDFKVGGENKQAAYEISVGEKGRTRREVIYVTRSHRHEGVRYLPSREGYSVLVVMSDPKGRELYGAFVPLQSHRQADGSFTYVTGSAAEAIPFPFPAPPEAARFDLLVTYRENAVEERKGDVTFEITPVPGTAGRHVKGRVAVGQSFDAGEVSLSPREIRYWVVMDVQRDPGLPIILGSLVAGLAGMVMIFVGRLRQDAPKRRAA